VRKKRLKTQATQRQPKNRLRWKIEEERAAIVEATTLDKRAPRVEGTSGGKAPLADD
jgi:hypothetical protein